MCINGLGKEVKSVSKQYCPYCMSPVLEGESCSVCGLTSGTYVPSPHHLPPGTILLDRYLVGRVLGEGGFGITYIGCDLRLELKVAIKEYYPVDRATRNSSASLEVTSFMGASAKSYERGKQKFLGEAQVMARMDKQQVIVGVRDFFEVNNTAYIVMEYIEGITFRDLVEQKGGKISPEELFPMIEPLFGALSMMHEKGLIHRDISPDNLMLENGKIRLLDFGCAREASRGTETMTIALKHGYAPLEQYQQKGQGPWTDIYALCATIYYCLTGKTPPQALDRITEDGLMIPSKLGIKLSENQERALLRGMRVTPNRRFSTVEELRAALYAKSPDIPEPVLPIIENTEDIPGRILPVTEETKVKRPEVNKDPETTEKEVSCQGTETLEEKTVKEKKTYTVVPEEEKTLTEEEEQQSKEKKVLREKPETAKKKWLLPTVAAAACVIIAIAVFIGKGLTKQEANDTANTELASEAESPGGPIDPTGFENATLFTSGDSEEFQRLMEDASVTAVTVECDELYTSGIAITKPVLVKKEANWGTNDLTVTETGYIQLEGTLTVSGYLRLQGQGVTRCFVSADASFITEECTLIWMDDAGCLVKEDGESVNAHVLDFSMDAFADAVSVKSFDELSRAAQEGKTISIDGDIRLQESVSFSAPVRISDGVTVDAISGDGGNTAAMDFYLEPGAVLVNYGTLNGSLTANNGHVINYGVLKTFIPDDGAYASLWMENACVLLNFGIMEASNCSRIWQECLYVNKGTLNAHAFVIVGGHMANYGSIVIQKQDDDGYFDIFNGGILWNKIEAEITVAKDTSLNNYGRIFNEGEILVEKDGNCKNTILQNEGLFRVNAGGFVDEGNCSGVYYGFGEFDLGSAQAKVYTTDNLQHIRAHGETLTTVTTEEELTEALENPGVEAVRISSEITVNTDLTVRKPLFITDQGALRLADGASLLDYGSPIALFEEATLQGKQITLYEDAQIYMEQNAVLDMEGGGILTLNSSLLWGYNGNIRLAGSELILENNAGFAFREITSMDMTNCTVSLRDNARFVAPQCTAIEWSSVKLMLKEGAGFCCMSDISLKDSMVTIGENARFFSTAQTTSLYNCTVTVQEGGNLVSDLSNFGLYSGSSLENRGRVRLGGWHEYGLVIHGPVTNYSDMYLDLKDADISEPINNQGTVYFGTDADYSSDISGNAPIFQ